MLLWRTKYFNNHFSYKTIIIKSCEVKRTTKIQFKFIENMNLILKKKFQQEIYVLNLS